MKATLTLAIALGFTLLFTPTVAGAEDEDQAFAKEMTIQALSEAAAGKCLRKTLSPLLLRTCREQIDFLKDSLSRLGPIEEATFLGHEDLPAGGEAEVYDIEFENGTQTWLARLDSRGRLNVLWAPGPPIESHD